MTGVPLKKERWSYGGSMEIYHYASSGTRTPLPCSIIYKLGFWIRRDQTSKKRAGRGGGSLGAMRVGQGMKRAAWSEQMKCKLCRSTGASG
jgi:hypothetical protein